MKQAAGADLTIEEKLDELIAMLNDKEIDSERVKQIQLRFNNAIENKTLDLGAIDAFKVIDEKDNVSRAELLDEFSTLLMSNKIDSNISSRYLKGARANRMVLILIALVMITLGFAMIIMPAPPYFEMFTIYYFSRDDGVTLMDLISLVIILAGIYILVRSLYKKVALSK